MTKTSVRAGVRVSSKPSAGSTAPRRRVTRKTQSARRPRTAYELLARVCEHIVDEPRRYYQEAWIIRHKARIKAAMGSVPSCGTMACRAGWIVGLHDGFGAQTIRQAHTCRTGGRANQILGLDSWETGELFSGDALQDTTLGRKPPKYGTAAYARLGVQGLRAFMREHATHLKARLLKDVPKLEGK